LEKPDQFADCVMAVLGMAEGELVVDLILIAATGARLR
jgi:hypothetical protein